MPLSFRQKILISYLVVFLLFLGLMFPFASRTIEKIVSIAMEERATEIISKIQDAPDDEALVQSLKDQKPLIFFRVSIITNERKVLYDSHMKRLLGFNFSQEYIIEHPEVLDAFKYGVGYSEGYSTLLEQDFYYMAKAFDFHGKTYVLRLAFPHRYIADATQKFEAGFLVLGTIVLLLFSILTLFIINHLTQPIQRIINVITPYQEGKTTTLPEVNITLNPNDDFGKLANTLNSLSSKIQGQIDTLTLERNEKEAVLNSLIEGVVAVDSGLVVTFANNMALKILGLSLDELINHPFAASNQPACDALLKQCLVENHVLTSTLQIKSGNNKLYLDVIAAPKIDLTGATLVLQDKTSHYKILEMRKDFIANASHELKTPITIIRGFAEALHDNPDLPQDTYMDVTEKIMRNCQRMATLIKDLLTLADIENIPESRLYETDLVALIENCCNMVRHVFPTAQITIHKPADKDFYMIADANLMEMAFMNLIENAAKYSTPPAHIDITLEQKDKWITLTIADKGIGIPKADLEHVFERFYTVNKAHSQKMGGSGLGLSIVYTIIEKHFGRISVESEIGKGTVFTVLLPESRDEKSSRL
jgi:two-component system, OmpR family, phosphate regulon sensor histidine kinase PhoR